MEKAFEIKLPQFEGPFDLLLFFIERDEIDIHNIPISNITNDFLQYIHGMTTLNIEVASEFILVASTLMRIKAKMLLPRPELDPDDAQPAMGNPRRHLAPPRAQSASAFGRRGARARQGRANGANAGGGAGWPPRCPRHPRTGP